jgi:predicted permease
MRWIYKFRLRLRTIFRRKQVEDELGSELQFHLEQQIAENIANGISRDEARYAALRKIGGITQIQEQCRETRGLNFLESTLQDLRYAIRNLRHAPAFTAVAVFSLALGIGANTAIFSLIDSLLLTSLPVHNPQNLFFVQTAAVKTGHFNVSRSISGRDMDQMLRRATQIESITAVQTQDRLSIVSNGVSELAPAELVSGTYFDLLGVRVALGRTLGPGDDSKTGNAGGQGWPAVISYGYWRSRFAGNPEIVGRPIAVNTIPFVIVGVAPPGFLGFSLDRPASIFLPMITSAQVEQGSVSAGFPEPDDAPGMPIVGLKPGTDPKKANAELTVLFHEAESENKGNDANAAAVVQKLSIELKPASQGESGLRLQYSDPLHALMGVVAAVMLIACANIAGLLIARGAVRKREFAIRLSLGSSRRRLIRQLLTESVVLAIMGSVAGLLFAIWARHSIVTFALHSSFEEIALPLHWDYHLLLFLVALCAATIVLFGIIPAWLVTRVDPQEVLKTSQKSHRSGRLPLGRVLIAGQIALSLALVVASFLFLATVRKLYRIDLGFNQEHLLMATMDPHLIGYSDQQAEALYKQALRRSKALPGIRSATLVDNPLFSGRAFLSSATVPGYVPKAGEDLSNRWTITYGAGPNFFSTLQMPLKEGRDFSEADTATSTPVVVINESMARHFFQDKYPIGRKISFRGKNRPDAEIVGVVRDAHYFSAQWETQEAIFTPVFQVEAKQFSPEQTLILRTAEDPARATADLRAMLRGLDPNLPIYNILTMREKVSHSFSQEQLLAALSGFFAMLALTLSAIGLYGVLAYSVSQRTGEIGVRMALGADRGKILRMILGETGQLLGIGVMAGLAMSFAATRLIKTMLYGVTPDDPRSFLFGSLILVLVGVCAALLPARRAVTIEPMEALRYE